MVLPGAGPTTTNPELVPDATKVRPLTTAWSIRLKFAFLMVKLAVPVLMLRVDPLSVARLLPPKLPEPVVRTIFVFCPPAGTSANVSTSTHLRFPEGQRPNTRNWPVEAPVNPSCERLVIPAVSARGIPAPTGSRALDAPDSPGGRASCVVRGM